MVWDVFEQNDCQHSSFLSRRRQLGRHDLVLTLKRCDRA